LDIRARCTTRCGRLAMATRARSRRYRRLAARDVRLASRPDGSLWADAGGSRKLAGGSVGANMAGLGARRIGVVVLSGARACSYPGWVSYLESPAARMGRVHSVEKVPGRVDCRPDRGCRRPYPMLMRGRAAPTRSICPTWPSSPANLTGVGCLRGAVTRRVAVAGQWGAACRCEDRPRTPSAACASPAGA
jgi:hypothetical protein